jgi:hypothetical protein
VIYTGHLADSILLLSHIRCTRNYCDYEKSLSRDFEEFARFQTSTIRKSGFWNAICMPVCMNVCIYESMYAYCNMHACLRPLLSNGPRSAINSGDAC